MDWQLDNDRPIYTQLVEHIARAVVTGLWPPGAKLPGVRELAAEAGVNPNTMQRALAELEADGLLHAKRTSGRFVTEDTARIQSLRERQATHITGQYVRNMAALGCTPQEIDGYIRRAKEESL